MAVKQAKGSKGILPDDSQKATESLAELEANFNPASDSIDRSILQKITGFGQSKLNDSEKNATFDPNANVETNRNLVVDIDAIKSRNVNEVTSFHEEDL